MRKKLVLVFTILVLALMALPLTVAAESAHGTGTVIAEGDGVAGLRGNGTVTISGQGHLVILDRAGDAQITIDHNGPELAAPQQSTDQRGAKLVFRNFDGTATVTGSRIAVALRHGTGVRLDAEGTGSVYLRGTGWYEITGADGDTASGSWSATGTTLHFGDVNAAQP